MPKTLPEGWSKKVIQRPSGKRDYEFTNPNVDYVLHSLMDVERYEETGDIKQCICNTTKKPKSSMTTQDAVSKKESLQEQLAFANKKYQEALDSLCREKEARAAAERLQSSISDELKRAQQDNDSSILKIQSLNDEYKQLQEYNASLQKYNSKLQSELSMTNDTLKRVEKEKAAVVENLSTLRGQYKSVQEQLMSSTVFQDEALRQKESLSSNVQSLQRKNDIGTVHGNKFIEGVLSSFKKEGKRRKREEI